MKYVLMLVSLIAIGRGALIPIPFYDNLQRIGYDSTMHYFDKRLFYDCYGIAMVKPRSTNSTFMIVSDPYWCRIIYTKINEQSEDVEYLRKFGGYGTSSDKFFEPRGLCFDTTVYIGEDTVHTIYVADSRNNRISKLKYHINADTIVANGILITGLLNPTDVACVSIADGSGSLIVVVEKDTHCIRLYQRDTTGTLSYLECYGEQGVATGQFVYPQGVAICKATDSQGGYFIYVTDTGNRRVVCLRYKVGQGISWYKHFRTNENTHFVSVTTSQYYCVYVTDCTQNKVWVFTQGLGELLYQYGNDNILNGPRDVCIDWDRIGLTERWTGKTGLQYFKILPEIKEFYPDPDTFDATTDSVKINFRVDETAGYLTMKCCQDTIIDNQYFSPGTASVYWDGREGSGKPAVPGLQTIYMHSSNHELATSHVIIKGTKIENGSTNLHWVPEGNPYVLVGNCGIGYLYDTLKIDAGVSVRGHDDNAKLSIGGRLQINGAIDDSVLFTAHRKLLPVEDSTYPGMWQGIYISSYQQWWNVNPVMKFSTVEFASCGIDIQPYTVLSDIIENCMFRKNHIPARCAFWSLGSFRSGNCFADNDTNEIAVLPCLYEAVYLDTLLIEKQDIPYVFRYLPFDGRNWGVFAVFGLISGERPATMVVEPGTRCEFEENTKLWIGCSLSYDNKGPGQLCAVGADSLPIVFTAADPRKPWDGIRLKGIEDPYAIEESTHLSYCDISYAGEAGIHIVNTSPEITDNQITNCHFGLIVSVDSSDPVIEQNLISLNECGILNANTGSIVLSISQNDIYGNKIAVQNDLTSTLIDADSNWWGDATGPWDPTDSTSGPPDYNPAGRGDSIGDYIQYREWLESPVQTQVVTLTNPNGDNILNYGENYTIQWSREVTPMRQELYYTTNYPEGGSTRDSSFWIFIDTVTVTQTNYLWTVPVFSSDRCRVAIKLIYEESTKSERARQGHVLSSKGIDDYTTHPQLMYYKDTDEKRYFPIAERGGLYMIAIDISDTNFTITDTISPQICVTAPNGGEYIIPTTSNTITWQATDNHQLDYFNIYLSTNGGLIYSDTIIENLTAPCSSCAWTPAQYNNYNCMVLVRAYDVTENYSDDESDSTFSIPVKSLSNEMTAYNNARRLVRSFMFNLHLVYTTAEAQTDKIANVGSNLIDRVANNVLLKEKVFTERLSNSIPPDITSTKFSRPQGSSEIHYVTSTDGGVSWHDDTDLGDGLFPTIAMEDDGTDIGVAWIDSSSSKVLYRYKKPQSWDSRTYTILDDFTDVTYAPVSMQYYNGYMHLVTMSTEEISSSEWVQDVLYTKFKWNKPDTQTPDTIDHWRIKYTGEMPSFVSVANDGSNSAHIAWERPPDDTVFNQFTPFDIFYTLKSGLGIGNKENVSDSDSNSIYPSIDCYGGHYYVVWKEKINGYSIFLYKRSYIGFPPTIETDTLTSDAINPSFPISRRGGIVLWSAGDTTDIYGRIWDSQQEEWLDIENWSNTPNHSTYPQVDVWTNEGSTEIYAGWTENTDTCGFGKRHVSIFPSSDYMDIAFPSYYLKLGDPLSTPFTLSRDTTLQYGLNLYDYGSDSLVYFLPYIERTALCKIYIELYQPFNRMKVSESENWVVGVNIDNIVTTNIAIEPGELKSVELDLPFLVNLDGAALIKFSSEIGDGILARRILFYEYERGWQSTDANFTSGGPQTSESMKAESIFFSGVFPNPTNRDLVVRLNSPSMQKVAIKLYDVTGRIVDEVKREVLGKTDITMRSDWLSAGIYFIHIDNGINDIIEKVIVLK